VLGGCKGTTGPNSINPKTGKNYGMAFPFITIKDMVDVQKKLIDYLGIKQLVSVIGGSMGGMQVLQWVSSYPEYLKSAIPIATTMRHSPQQIAFNEVAREAIIVDSDWKGGDYYNCKNPELGLSIARMIGHITYMSDNSMESKFSRRKKEDTNSFEKNFEVENYLHQKGDDFVKRFDANSYLYITKAMDYFDISDKLFIKKNQLDIKFLVIAFESDWLYPTYQSLEIIKNLRQRHVPVTYCSINSTYGHDAFLLEADEETKLIKPFLSSILNSPSSEGVAGKA
jgi:homoserine O-acetyltransferase